MFLCIYYVSLSNAFSVFEQGDVGLVGIVFVCVLVCFGISAIGLPKKVFVVCRLKSDSTIVAVCCRFGTRFVSSPSK